MSKKQPLNVRVSETEMQTLNNYCDITARSKTEVIREFIRSLQIKQTKGESNDHTQNS